MDNWDHLQDWVQDDGPVKIKVFDQDVLLYFPYAPVAINMVKRIEGAEYAAHDKSWTLHVTEENMRDVAALIGDLELFFAQEAVKASQAADHRRDIAPLVAERLSQRYDHPKLIIEAEDEYVAVNFPYHQKSVAAIKKIEGRRWDGDVKCWLLPADQERKIRSALNKILRVLNNP